MYEYKGLVLEVLDYDTIIVEVDLGFDCRRIMYLRIKGTDFCLKEIITIFPNRDNITKYISDLIKGKTIYFVSHKTKKRLDYDVEIVYTSDSGDAKFLLNEIKNKFCKK